MRRGALAVFLLLLLCACTVNQPEQTTEPPPVEELPPVEEPNSGVYTDWSKLGEREPLPEVVGSRWYEDYTNALIPREDYGPLIPYAGLRLMDNWPAMTGCLYGLMTRDGAVVTDPVYSSVSCPNGFGREGFYTLPLLVLEQADEAAGEEDWDLAAYAVAARDGSWCTPFDYCGYAHSEEGLLLFQPDSITVMAPDGEIQRVWTVEETGFSQEAFDSMLNSISWGEGWSGSRTENYMAIDWVENGEYNRVLCFDLVTGELCEIPDEEFYAGYPEGEDHPSPIPDAYFQQDSLLGSGAPGLLVKSDYSENGVTAAYFREDGTPLPQLTPDDLWYCQVNLIDGLVEVLDWNMASYYDLETWECVFRTYLNYEGD